jgi:hypothetical protein
MRKTVEKLKSVDDTAEIYCNICGGALSTDSFGYFPDHLSVDKKWGYASDFDNERHEFDICAQCYKKLISSFVIPIHTE